MTYSIPYSAQRKVESLALVAALQLPPSFLLQKVHYDHLSPPFLLGELFANVDSIRRSMHLDPPSLENVALHLGQTQLFPSQFIIGATFLLLSAPHPKLGPYHNHEQRWRHPCRKHQNFLWLRVGGLCCMHVLQSVVRLHQHLRSMCGTKSQQQGQNGLSPKKILLPQNK